MDNVNKFQDDDLGLDHGDDEPTRRPAEVDSPVPSLIPDNPHEDPIMLDDAMNDFQMPMDDPTIQLRDLDAPADPRLERDSQSPLSSVRSSVVRTFPFGQEDEEESTMPQAHRAKKRKTLRADTQTQLTSAQIKALQDDRSAILKPASFLPGDPVLLSLMNMQKNGEFVSDTLGNGQTKGWAPELRGILSIAVVRKSGELKRKRDSGVVDVEEEDAQADKADKAATPQLEVPDDEDQCPPADEGLGADPTRQISEPADDGIPPPLDANNDDLNSNDQLGNDDAISPIRDTFDETTAPLLHPLDSGPISLGTQHAVHLLRDRFSASTNTDLQTHPESPSLLKKAQTLFHDMLPVATTSKAEATKMFFEVLVLATKDAVKVEQSPKELGGPLRIRGKRGLWGAWAEREAGGEIEAHDGEVEA
jgi:cohesin complex subunit SCC1